MDRVVALNGGLGGPGGNTAELVVAMTRALEARGAAVEIVHLATLDRHEELAARLRAASGLVVATGTYWDSWSSAMQSFFEVMTPTEGTDVWLGKPAATLVTMHSVGGKEVLSRLQGVLCTLGASIPPMSGLALSLASLEAHRESDHADDFWSLEDLDVIAHNLTTAMRGRRDYRSWTVDRANPARKWLSTERPPPARS